MYKKYWFPAEIIQYAARLRQKHQGYGDAFFTGEVFKVDQAREVNDVFLQNGRAAEAAKWFFSRIVKKHRDEPREIVGDRLQSYGVAHGELIFGTIHNVKKCANNRTKWSRQPTRVWERGMRRRLSCGVKVQLNTDRNPGA